MEKEAISSIKCDPSTFYHYAKKHCKDASGIATLRRGDKLCGEDSDKADILRLQYRAMWSKPFIKYSPEDMSQFFSMCGDCEAEVVHMCKFDEIPSNIADFADYIMSLEDEVNDERLVKVSKNPELTDLLHMSADFLKAIESIPSRAACGPDGWTAPLVKGLKHPLS